MIPARRDAPPARLLVWMAAVVLWLGAVVPAAWAQPTFPPLTGRVVDNANLISPSVEQELDTKLAALQTETSDQLVVVTVPDLQGYEIEDYGYQLGRAWGIGQSETNNGLILLVAPNERKVRIEVGYGLEPIVTDAFSALVIQNDILPQFRSGDYEAGIVSGVDALSTQLRLDPAEAQARAAAAAAPQRSSGGGSPALVPVVILIIFIFVFIVMANGGARGRRRAGLGGIPPVIIWNDDDWKGGGGGGWGGGGGGGGFSGGGGSFGGGGASGGW